VLRRNGNRVQSGRVAFGGVAPIPWQEDALNNQLSGLVMNDQNLEKVIQSAFTDASPLERNGYKVPLVRNVTRQALKDLMA
ncbi:MAG TPA: xanthine dehydrogenase family protein subunit M, partial [bacterium]|nr:xanthine dehydrogenase family protein subunit M [bacterium]